MINTTVSKQEQVSIGLIEQNLKAIAKEIRSNIETTDKTGLLNGKMGIAIFFYKLSRFMGNQEYESFADGLIDEIFERINKKVVPFDFSGGLAGIAWGIEYLSENKFLEGDTNEILADLDDKVYQHYTAIDNIKTDLTELLLGYGFYMLARYKKIDKSGNSSQQYIYKRLIMDVVNKLSACIDNGFIDTKEPPLYCITWKLPLLLLFLGKVFGLNIYNEKVIKLTEQLSPAILSLLPVQHANRLLLLFGMHAFYSNCKIRGWEGHIKLLEEQVEVKKILNEEMNRNKYDISMGYNGVFLILSEVRKYSAFLKDNTLAAGHLLKEGHTIGRKDNEIPDLSLLRGLSGKGLGILKGLQGNWLRL